MQQSHSHPAYRPDIDGMRAIAVLLVIGSHAFPAFLGGGFIGVDIFFVISGYLISTIILNGLKKERFSYLDFYSRRIRRIFPALLVVLASCLVAGWFLLFADEYQALGEHTAGGAGFIANLLYFKESGYFDTSRDYKPLLHLWSLGVEEQYYLIWPLFLGFVYRRTHRSLRVIVAFLLISFVCDIWITAVDPNASYYLPITRFWELMIGSLLAYVGVFRHDLEPDAARGRRAIVLPELLSWAGVALLVAAVIFINPSKPYPGWWALLPTLSAAAFIAAGPATTVNRLVLAFRPLVWVGLISYPLYLWHWPLISFSRIIWFWPSREIRLIAVALAIALAWLTYQLLEKPIRSSRGPSAVFALLAGMIVVAGAGLFVNATGGLTSRPIQTAKQATITLISSSLSENSRLRDALALEAGHCEGLPIAPEIKTYCASYGAPSAAPIVVWGDSHTWSWLPAFIEIGRNLGVEVITFEHPGCPPMIGIRRVDGSGIPAYCKGPGMGAGIVQAIEAIKPQRVFLICRWSLYAQPHFIEFMQPTASAEDSGAQPVFTTQFFATLKAVTAVAPVTVIRTTPTLKSEVKRGMLRDLPLEPTTQQHREEEARANEAIDLATRQIPRVDAFDPADLLCKQTCAAVIDQTLIYVDDNHITYQGALLFRSSLEHAYFTQALSR